MNNAICSLMQSSAENGYNQPSQKSNTHLQKWLTCRHLINNLESDNIIKCSVDAIIESFGGFKKVLERLIEQGNETELKSILDIIRSERLKYLQQKELTQQNDNISLSDDDERNGVVVEENDILILNNSINTNESKFQFFLDMPN
eukprot:407308_1